MKEVIGVLVLGLLLVGLGTGVKLIGEQKIFLSRAAEGPACSVFGGIKETLGKRWINGICWQDYICNNGDYVSGETNDTQTSCSVTSSTTPSNSGDKLSCRSFVPGADGGESFDTFEAYRWLPVDNCTKSCSSNKDCLSDNKDQVGWCYGFSEGNLCLQLKWVGTSGGTHLYNNGCSIIGWACDPLDYQRKDVVIDFYWGFGDGGHFIGSTTANLDYGDPAVAKACGNSSSAHAFNFDIPDVTMLNGSMRDGKRRDVYAYARYKNGMGGVQFVKLWNFNENSNGPVPVQCSSPLSPTPAAVSVTPSPTGVTTKVQVAFDSLPADWDNIPEQDYTAGMKVQHTFSPDPGDKFIFVRFKTNTGKTSIRQLKITLGSSSNISPIPTSISTPVPGAITASVNVAGTKKVGRPLIISASASPSDKIQDLRVYIKKKDSGNNSALWGSNINGCKNIKTEGEMAKKWCEQAARSASSLRTTWTPVIPGDYTIFVMAKTSDGNICRNVAQHSIDGNDYPGCGEESAVDIKIK